MKWPRDIPTTDREAWAIARAMQMQGYPHIARRLRWRVLLRRVLSGAGVLLAGVVFWTALTVAAKVGMRGGLW